MEIKVEELYCANCEEANYIPACETEFICDNCGFRNWVSDGEVTGAGGPDMAYMWCEAWSEAYSFGKASAFREMIGKWNSMPRLVRAAAGLANWAWWHWIK